MTEPTFGFSINPEDNEPRATAGADFSVIGLVGTAMAADATAFPLDTPVLIYSNDTAMLTKLGATGTLPDAVAGVNDQLADFQAATKIVIVRVAPGVDAAATMAAVVGVDATRTGLYALKRAAALTGVTPRLIAVPGFTSQRTGNAANAVCAALPAVLAALLAHAVVDGPNTNKAAAVAWRTTITDKRTIPVEGGVLVSVAGTPTAAPLAPRILGLAAAIDHANKGLPFKSWANRAIKGILGPARDIDFSLTDGACEAQDLLAANIGVLVRGEAGVDGALADGGFVFVGTDNAGDDDLWRFYHQVRGRDYIHLYFLRVLRFYLGRFNLTTQTVQATLNTMRALLRDLQTDSLILGFQVQFRPDQNSPEQLRLGRMTVRFAAEEAPVLRQIRVTVNGKDISPAIAPVLNSLKVRDESGATSDTAEIELDDAGGAILLPKAGAAIRIELRDQVGLGLVFSGTVDAVKSSNSRGSGKLLRISAKGVNLLGRAKQIQERHFDDVTLGDALRQAGAAAGVSEVRVDPDLAGIHREYLAMEGESFLAFGQRLAREIGGTFKVAGDVAVLVKRNSGATASGRPLGGVEATLGANLLDWDLTPFVGRARHRRARARHYDVAAARHVETTVMVDDDPAAGSDPDPVQDVDPDPAIETDPDPAAPQADAVLRYASADGPSAANQVKAAAGEISRAGGSGTVTINGDTSAKPGALLTLKGARPGIDGTYRIEAVEHSLDRNGGTVTRLEVGQPHGGAGRDGRA